MLRDPDPFSIMVGEVEATEGHFNVVVLSGHYHIGQIVSEYKGLDLILVPSLVQGDRTGPTAEIVLPPEPLYTDLIYFGEENKLQVEVWGIEEKHFERTIYFEDLP